MRKAVKVSTAAPRTDASEVITRFVTSRESLATEGPTVRLTLNLDKVLHRRLRKAAFERETTIADLVRALVAQHYPED